MTRQKIIAVTAVAVAVVIAGSYFALSGQDQDETPGTTTPSTVQQYDDDAPQTNEDFERDSKMGRSPRETPVPGSNTIQGPDEFHAGS
ncbi:hypothetical protein [Rhodococcus sp. (in: high G+C Gram-positive bacteria)]|uniref:hypothetical protein n=1 Tax=Rhodococcus sp. TaxID=1831 RepID=UPI0025799869|nr:hypothetical protein [Rhodococcus sp. (in: high G+C Gram-positive bacteria)]MBQ7805083.1 hypothetical protein [Rhodococcus sp. (in: high G+C Gram-positive bacteria)]